MTVTEQTLHRSLRPQAGNIHYDHVKMGGSDCCKLIAHHLSVECRKTSTVKPSLSEAVSQGQWIHPISTPPPYIWFNIERRGPQTELWESVQQQCGQVVNTQTWSGRTGLQTGLISSGLSRPADRGGGERIGGGGTVIWAPFIPVVYPSLAGSIVIWAVRIQLKVRHWKKHYNEARGRQTHRQMHLEAEVLENSWDPPICEQHNFQ